MTAVTLSHIFVIEVSDATCSKLQALIRVEALIRVPTSEKTCNGDSNSQVSMQKVSNIQCIVIGIQNSCHSAKL